MVHLGQVSASRRALEGAALAHGDNTTLSQFRDQSRGPAFPREALPEDLACFVPEQDFVLEGGWFSHNLRKARRGAAPGPSGMTADHLRPLLDVSADSLALGQVAALFSRAQVPPEIMDALGAGRLTALTVEWEESWWERSSGESQPGRSPNSTPRRWKSQPPLFSTF